MFKKGLVALLLVGALVVRLYKIDNPVADWHSFRQADTASVTREFIKNGPNILVPTYHDHSNIQSGKDNPKGYRMVEMPLYNYLHYLTYNLFPSLGLDVTGKLHFYYSVSLLDTFYLSRGGQAFWVFCWLVGGIFLFIFTIQYLLFQGYFARAFDDRNHTRFVLEFLIKMSESFGSKKFFYLIISALMLSVSILVKPFALFFALPHFAVAFRNLAKNEINILSFILYMLLAVTPFVWWRKHILLYPEGIPASDWLINSSGIRFRPAWFRWLFGERIGKLILGIYGTTFLSLGLIAKPAKEGITYWLWALGIFAYFSIIAGGNVQHDYYQAIIVPFLCFLLAKGFILLVSLSRATYSRFLTIIMAAILLVSMISLSWYDIKGYYQVNNWPIVRAGEAVRKMTPENSLVIAPYNGDTPFLYQTHRSGWPLGYDIEDKINKGATHYVSVVYDDEARQLEKKYTVLEKNNEYILIDLKQKAK